MFVCACGAPYVYGNTLYRPDALPMIDKIYSYTPVFAYLLMFRFVLSGICGTRECGTDQDGREQPGDCHGTKLSP